MPTYEIDVGGKIYEVEAPNPQAAAGALKGLSGQPQGAPPMVPPTPAVEPQPDLSGSPGGFQTGNVQGTYEQMFPEWAKQAAGFFAAPKQAAQSVQQLASQTGLVDAPSEQDVKDWRMAQEEGMVGNVAGNLAMLALPMGAAEKGLRGARALQALPKSLQAIAPAAAVGATEAATLQPVLGGESRLTNAAVGGVLPFALKAAAKPLTGLIKPTISGAKLLAQNIVPTAGQGGQGILSGALRSLEELGSILPVGKRGIKQGLQRASREAMDIASDRASPIAGADVPPMSRGESYTALLEQFDEAYGNIFKGKTISVPSSVKSRALKKAEAAAGRIPDAERAALKKDLDFLFPGYTGRMGGQSLRELRNRLHQRSRDAWAKGNRNVALAYDAADESLFDSIPKNQFSQLERESLEKLDKAWGNYKTLEKAGTASTVAPESGVTAEHLIDAVEQSTPDNLLVQSRGRFQDLTEPLKGIYREPDVQTPLGALSRRGAYQTAGAVLGGGLGVINPLLIGPMWAAARLSASRPGAKALMGQYGPQREMAKILRNYSGTLGAALTSGQRDESEDEDY